ncbi:MAG TPA: efflux transporter outer membrane subunit [Candidatus Acidoferrum sp.]
MKVVRPIIAVLFAALIVMLLFGCEVGPKYSRATAPTTPAFKEAPPQSFTEAGNWKTAQPDDQTLRGKWWEVFGDPELNDLEEQLTISNQNLKVAETRLREARAAVRFNRAAQFPTISVGPSIQSVHASANRPYIQTTGNTGDFILPVDLSYEVDLWGRIRRTVAAAREEAQATAADYATAGLSLHAELAIDYFEIRSADAQKQLLDQTVKAYSDALELTTNRFKGGVAPKSDVAQAKTQLETTQVQDTDVTVARAQFEHAIAILIGKPPAELNLAAAPLDRLPPTIPGLLPSQLLERRPDIAAAERRMAEANQQIGIARAAYFPTLSLGATAGFEGTSLLNWLNWPSRLWAVGPQMSETLYDGGRRRANSETAIAGYDGAIATYRQTTLTAFQEVEDNLAALRILDSEAQQQQEATSSAQESLQLFTNRYKGGVDTYLQVITAQTIALQNERNEVDILRRRMDASVLLIKAVGGGWSTAELPKEASLR